MVTHKAGVGSLLILALFLLPAIDPSALLVAQRSNTHGSPYGISARRTPILFTENIGQWRDDVRFQGTVGSATVRFGGDRVSYCYLVDSVGSPSARSRYHLLGTEFLGSSPDVRVTGDDPAGSASNFYLGADSTRWHLGARGFHGVRYQGLYSGIDAIYHEHDGRMKYDFLLAPGADASAIRLRYDGARALRLKENGEMEATTDFGIVHEAAPYSYQEIGGKRVPVEAAYRLIGRDSYGFRLGPHDPTRPVVIDPCLSVEYATFLGGGGYDVVTNVAADSAGFAYATGFTRAPDFPLLPQVDTIDQDNYVFISKITPDGALVYSTFIAQAYDSAYSSTITNLIYESIGEDVEATKNGEAVIALSTNRENLATTANAYKRQLTKNDINGPCGPAVFRNFDLYVARLDISGKLKWGTYLGNTNNDYLSDIALDNNENVYLTGFTYGATCLSGPDPAGDKLTFPITGTPGTFTSTDTLRNLDAYVTVLNADGRNLRFSALYGGAGNDIPSKIVVDQAGKVYIFGSTNSTNLPTSLNAFQRTRAAGATAGTYDLFLAKIDPVTENLDYSSYICDNGPGRIGLGFSGFSPRPFDETIGGFDRRDRLQGMILDRANGTLILAGTTRSGTLPTTSGVIGPGSRGTNGVDESANDAYLIRFSTAAAGIVTATYLGGSDFDGLGGIGFDRFGDIAVSISTKSTDFPLSAVAIQQSLRGKVDAVITTISPDFRQLTYGSYYGGNATQGDRLWEQIVSGLTVDKDGGIYIYGATSSRDFPLSQHPISSEEDYYQGYLVKFSAPSAAKIGLGLSLLYEPNTCGDLQTKQTTIFNSGQTPMQVTDLHFKFGKYFRLINPPALPFTLAPCDTLSLTVGFDAKDLECKTTATDSLVIGAPAAANPIAQLLVSGKRTCASIFFDGSSVDLDRYKLGSGNFVGFGINVQGATPQTITIIPDSTNKGIFRPTQPLFQPGIGTSSLSFSVNAPDTGHYCESFTAIVQPCNIRHRLSICAYVKSGIFSGPDSLGYGLISCREIDQPVVIRNVGNDSLAISILYVSGQTPKDIEFVADVQKILTIAPKDSLVYQLRILPKGAGKHESIVVFHTDEGDFFGRQHWVVVSEELDSVAMRLMSSNIVGGFGDIVNLPVEYQPILEGRVPLEELTLYAQFDPKLLTITGLDPIGSLLANWEIVKTKYSDSGAIFTMRKGSRGVPLGGTGRLMNLKLKVLRGDTVASPLDLHLAGASKGCIYAEIDSGRIFQLNAECASALRLLFTNKQLLKQSAPNPTGGMVTIGVDIPEESYVTLTIYDDRGREVIKLLDGIQPAGPRDIRFDSHAFAPGVYYYRITVGDSIHETRTMVIER